MSYFGSFIFFGDGQASESNLKSRLACLDGALRDLGEGGEIRTKALSVEETRINVWS